MVVSQLFVTETYMKISAVRDVGLNYEKSASKSIMVSIRKH